MPDNINQEDYGLSNATNAASDFTATVKAIETEFEQQISSLEALVSHLQIELANKTMEVSDLKEELANQPDCEEDDGYAKSLSPEELAGDPPKRVSGGGDGQVS